MKQKPRPYYVEFLGFTLDWEHRFEPGFPLYLQVSRNSCRLHWTEHHGDCSPGAALRIQVTELDAFHAELSTKSYKFSRPTIESMPWGARDMKVTDPFGNRLTFAEEIAGP